MSSVAFEILVTGVMDGTTPFVFPEVLPDPINGVHNLSAGDLGIINPVIGNDTFNYNLDWVVRAFHLQLAPATRAVRTNLSFPTVDVPQPMQVVFVGAPPLLPILPPVLIPRGGQIVMLTDDVGADFTGSPVPGPHRVYIEAEPVLDDAVAGFTLGILDAVVKVSRLAEFSAFLATAESVSNTTLTAVPLTQAFAPNPRAFFHVDGSDSILIQQTGRYEVTLTGSSDRIAGGRATQIWAVLLQNTSVIIPGLQVWSGHTSPLGEGSAAAQQYVDLESGDVLQLVTQRFDGNATLEMIPFGVGLTIRREGT